MVQKKKSDEQDVLVVRDEKTGEISVVDGLRKDGTQIAHQRTRRLQEGDGRERLGLR